MHHIIVAIQDRENKCLSIRQLLLSHRHLLLLCWPVSLILVLLFLGLCFGRSLSRLVFFLGLLLPGQQDTADINTCRLEAAQLLGVHLFQFFLSV